MKKIFFVLSFVFVFSACQKNNNESYVESEKLQESDKIDLDYGFSKSDKSIYFEGKKVGGEEIDLKSFKVLDDSYLVDKDGICFIYAFKDGFNFARIKELNVSTIVVLKNLYIKDDKNVYFRGVKLEKTDAETFEVLDGSKYYARDKNNCYNKLAIVDRAFCKEFNKD